MKFSTALPLAALAATVLAQAADECAAPPPPVCGWGQDCSWETTASWGFITRIKPTSTVTSDDCGCDATATTMYTTATVTAVVDPNTGNVVYYGGTGQGGSYSGGGDTGDVSLSGVVAGNGGSSGQNDPNGALGNAVGSLGPGGYQAPSPTSPFQNSQPSNNASAPAQSVSVQSGVPNGPTNRGAWATGYDINTDFEESWPTTGNTVSYNFVVSNMTMNPDGVERQMLVINGQYPGPTIEANWGDYIEVTVTNDMQHNGTGIHWHGVRQLNSNDNDGVGGLTECPIAPGQSKTYRWQATQYGSSWYHSHFSIQYGAGVVGPIVINGPSSANYDVDLGPAFITDLYPLTIFQEDWVAHHAGPPPSSNYAWNGQNTQPDGSGGSRMTWTFEPGKKYLLRLINAAVDGIYKIQLDSHQFTIVSADFVPIIPYTTSEITIAIGQRYDVIIEANQATSSYFLRAIAAQECCQSANTGTGLANAVIQYEGAPAGVPTNRFVTASTTCFDISLADLVPVVPKTVDQGNFASQFDSLPVNLNRVALQNGDQVFQWYLNGVSQNINWSNPSIGEVVSNGSSGFAATVDAIVLPTANVWTYWVIQNQFFVPHPMHLHGHDFSVLGQGSGTFNPSTMMSQLNFVNPTRRDVAMLISSGWTVIAFKTDNPGAWLMHCHIGWHSSEGLSLQFIERPADMATQFSGYVNGAAYQDNCAAWNTYFDGPVAYNKSDSGLRRRTGEHMDVVRHLQNGRRQHRRSIF